MRRRGSEAAGRHFLPRGGRPAAAALGDAAGPSAAGPRGGERGGPGCAPRRLPLALRPAPRGGDGAARPEEAGAGGEGLLARPRPARGLRARRRGPHRRPRRFSTGLGAPPSPRRRAGGRAGGARGSVPWRCGRPLEGGRGAVPWQRGCSGQSWGGRGRPPGGPLRQPPGALSCAAFQPSC